MALPRRIRGVRDVTTYVAQQFTAARSPRGVVDSAVSPVLSTKSELSGPTGYELVRAARGALEQSVRNVVSGLDAMSLFLAARCISPRVWSTLGPRGDDIQPGVRSALELAIQKYATWNPSQRGLLTEPTFLPAHLTVVGNAFALSEAYAAMLATQRRIAKGQTQFLESLAPLVISNDNSEIDRLISRLDRRKAESDDPLSLFGLVSEPRNVPPSIPLILGATFVQPSEVLDTTGDPSMEQLEDGSSIPVADRVTRWGFIPEIVEFQRALPSYDSVLREIAGYGLIDLLAVEHLITIAILERYGRPESVPRSLSVLGLAHVPPEVAILFRDVSGTHPYDAMDPGLAPTPERLALAFDHLLARPHKIDLTSPTVRHPLLEVGDGYVYDLTAAGSVFSPLFIEQELPEPERQALTNDFEVRTHKVLADYGEQPWVARRILRVDGRPLTDVDASVKVGDLLVVADCYSSPWSRTLDVGTHSRVRNRAEHLVAKLGKWQDQWKQIAQDHPRLVPAGVELILPVVVTAGPEWVSSGAPQLWLTDEVPAILTAHELAHLMDEGHLRELRNVLRVKVP